MFGYKDHRQTLNKFKQMLLDKFGNNLISLVVFGSIARGTAMKESDIDLLIILKEASDVYYRKKAPSQYSAASFYPWRKQKKIATYSWI